MNSYDTVRRSAALASVFLSSLVAAAETSPQLVLVRQHPTPVLTVSSPGAEGNRIEIRSVAGSWFLYDRVALEGPAGLSSMPVEKLPAPPSVAVSKDVRITVDLAHVVNTMRGGIGASWHAIEEPIPVCENPHPVFPNKSHGGSGWGAYPPAEDDAAWAQIDRHARWLGLDWNRVEFEQRIYEPERGQFSWDNPEMRILYRILDWCERNKADVFLQQMWGNVRWNTFPEWRDDPVARVHSGPQSMEDFGEGLATLVEHLVKNETLHLHPLAVHHERAQRQLVLVAGAAQPAAAAQARPGRRAQGAGQARARRCPLSGPDLTGGVPELDPQRFDFHELLGAYDFHSYDENFDWLSKGQMLRHDRTTAAWAAWAHQQGKPLFMSEIGTMANGWGAAHAGPGSYESVLKDCELVVRRLNAGADGFNRWSFLNRGDLDGAWQFIETWDRQAGKLLTGVHALSQHLFRPRPAQPLHGQAFRRARLPGRGRDDAEMAARVCRRACAVRKAS